MGKIQCIILGLFYVTNLFSQSPGFIVRPNIGSGPVTLNPDGNRYTSATSAGFTTSDITQSEIQYKIIKPLFASEPTSDLATGPNGGYSDIVKAVDGSGCYIYYDGTNLLFRLRIGGIVSGAKAYNILFDTDLKLGAAGANADPNYVPATNNGNGNAGFEWEVALETGSSGRVAVYNVDGVINPTASTTYSLNTNHIVSVALSRESGDADYFYDFFVPASALGLTPTSPFRIVVTTNTNPGSAFQGTRSDIYGIDDSQFTNTTDAWQYVASNTPSFTLNDVSVSGTGPGNPCTAAPTLSSGISSGSNVTVGGTWTKLVGSSVTTATITVYKNGVSQGTTTCNSGGNWSFIVSSIATGDVFTAAAQASGESMCSLSNSVVATSCSPANISSISSMTISCASARGMEGTKLANARIKIYTITAGGNLTLFATDNSSASPSGFFITYSGTNSPTGTSWEYNGANNGGQQGACSGGNADMPNATFVFSVTEASKCESGLLFITPVSPDINCISGTQTAIPTIAQTVIYPTTTVISGTAAASSTVRMLVNDFIVATTTATAGGNYSFNYSGGFQIGDVVTVRAQASGQCISAAASRTVTCFTSLPAITTDAQGSLTAGAVTVSGTSSEPNGTIIRVILSPSTQIGTATVSNGTWSASVSPALVSGSSYFATAQNGTCAVSANSANAVARTATTICPAITGSYTEGASPVTGTLPSSFTGTVYLYQDGSLIGSTTVSAATTWSITISASNPLYAGGVLTVGAQATGGTVNRSCASTVTVGCAVPSTPAISPSSTTINVGQAVTYTVSSTQSGILYSITDAATGATNYASSNFGNGSSVQFTTSAFSSPGIYSLKVNAISLSGSNCISAASMSVTVNGVLPLNWLGFELRALAGNIQLEWITANEKNVRDFVVEHSNDGQQWIAIGQVLAKNTGSSKEYYQFLHNSPQSGINYYRIQQRDEDGQFSYSVIRKINISGSARSLMVYPNPASGNLIQVQLEQSGVIEIYDAQGKRMLRKQLFAGIQTIDIHTFSKGVYLLRTAGEQILFIRQ